MYEVAGISNWILGCNVPFLIREDMFRLVGMIRRCCGDVFRFVSQRVNFLESFMMMKFRKLTHSIADDIVHRLEKFFVEFFGEILLTMFHNLR